MRFLQEGNLRAEQGFRGVGVSPMIFLFFSERKNAGEMPAPPGQASLPT
jgi:hypothetical protein